MKRTLEQDLLIIVEHHIRVSLMAQSVMNLRTMWETYAQSLGWEDPLEEGMATHSRILAWIIPMDRAGVHGVTKNQT